MCDFMLKLNSRGLIGLTSYYCQENNKCRLGNEGEYNLKVKRARAGVVRGMGDRSGSKMIWNE